MSEMVAWDRDRRSGSQMICDEIDWPSEMIIVECLETNPESKHDIRPCDSQRMPVKADSIMRSVIHSDFESRLSILFGMARCAKRLNHIKVTDPQADLFTYGCHSNTRTTVLMI